MADTTGVLVIGADAVLTGDVKGAKAVEIYGVIDGGVSAGDVTVRQGGKLNGWIKSDTSTVEGVLKGDVRVQQLITIRSTGSVEGNVKYGRLAMDEGAELTASVRNVPPSLGGDLDVTVKRGRTVKITPSDLKAIDPDDAPDALTFKVSNVVGGMITQSGAPGPRSRSSSATMTARRLGRRRPSMLPYKLKPEERPQSFQPASCVAGRCTR